MRLVRPAVALTLGVSLAVAGSASAASKPTPKPKPVCNLITDDTGDANDPLGGAPAALRKTPNNAGLDIVGGDFATTAKVLTTVLTLSQAPGLDPTSPQGDYFYVEFQPKTAANLVYLSAHTDVQGKVTYEAGSIVNDPTTGNNYTPNATIPVRGNVTGATIKMSVDLAALTPLSGAVKAGTPVSGLKAETFGVIDAQAEGLLINGDAAEGKPYVAGTPSCVVPVP